MDDAKIPRARAILQAKATRCCEHCWPLAEDDPARVLVLTRHCVICNGSNNRRAALELKATMSRVAASRLLVVGGTPANHRALKRLLEDADIELRCIDGAVHAPTQKEAWGDLQWADITVIWASTPLPHKVSNLYTAERLGRPPLTVAQRGIGALCREVRRSLELHGA